MKVSGFSFIKNAVRFDYPIVEAIRSILPLCDEVVVAVGDSDDGTRELVASIDPKVRIIDSVWDESLKENGRVLAVETDKALAAVAEDSDWCIYIQGDEVMHEDGYGEVRKAMERWKDDKGVDGLLLKYKHFYGSFDYVGTASQWYRHEIRVIRKRKDIYSYKDAQGFRKGDNEKLRVKAVNAYIYHYGWVREPSAMQSKWNNFVQLYHGEEMHTQAPSFDGPFDYSQIDALELFKGRHPAVMQERIKRMNWKFEYDLSYNKNTLKERFKSIMDRVFGFRPFDYKNYKKI